MSLEKVLRKEIEDSQRWLNLEKDESTYKRDLAKRIELINWVLNNMKNPDISMCDLLESRMNEIIIKMNITDSVFESDPLDSELRILDWILFQVCSNKIKSLK